MTLTTNLEPGNIKPQGSDWLAKIIFRQLLGFEGLNLYSTRSQETNLFFRFLISFKFVKKLFLIKAKSCL